MDIGKIINNGKFYDGYEDEPEIILSLSEKPEINIHIWEGYFADIFCKPVFNGKPWTGFTRDYQELKGMYDDDGTAVIDNIPEYLADILQYKDRKFTFDETKDVFELTIALLLYASLNHCTVKTQLI